MCRSSNDPGHRRCHVDPAVRRARQNAAYRARVDTRTPFPGASPVLQQPPAGVTRDQVTDAITEARRLLAETRRLPDGRFVNPLVEPDYSRGGWDYPTDIGLRAEQAVRQVGGLVAARADKLAADRLAQLHQLAVFADREVPVTSADEWAAQVRAERDRLLAERKPLTDALFAKPEDPNYPADPRERATVRYKRAILSAQLEPVEAEWGRIGRGEGRWDLEVAKVRADAYREALSEQRTMGAVHGPVDVHRDSSRAAVARLNEALGCYPTDWIEADRRYDPLHDRVFDEDRPERAPLYVRDARMEKQRTFMGTEVTKPERAFYANSKALQLTGRADEISYQFVLASRVPKGAEVVDEFWGKKVGDHMQRFTPDPDRPNPPSVKRYVEVRTTADKVKGMRRASELVVDDVDEGCVAPGVSTAIHEYGHRAERVQPMVNQVMRTFLARRTSFESDGARHPLTTLFADADEARRITPPATAGLLATGPKAADGRLLEFTRSDGFADAYIGKQYPDTGNSEAFSMGMEGVFAGRFGGLVGAGGCRADVEHRDLILGVLATC